MKKKTIAVAAFLLVFLAACSAPPTPTLTAPPAPPTPTPTLTLPPPPAAASPTPTQPAPEPPAAPSPTPTPTSLPPKDCTDVAAYLQDVTIPDGSSFKQNVPFVKTWRFQNKGTCTWGPNYAVVFHSGDPLGAAFINPLPPAAPGEVVEVSVNMVSPASGGAFTGYWQFQDPYGTRFGTNSGGLDLFWVKIGVSIYDESGALVPVVGGGSPVTLPAGCSPQTDPQAEANLLSWINAARAAEGLAALTRQSALDAAAAVHSADMGCNQFVDHTGSNGSTWNTRIRDQGYKAAAAAENIYVGDPAFGGDAQGAWEWWMNSPVHRSNILSAKATEVGIAYAYVPGSPFKGYYTLVFARPAAGP